MQGYASLRKGVPPGGVPAAKAVFLVGHRVTEVAETGLNPEAYGNLRKAIEAYRQPPRGVFRRS
jgi:hypothetical protein